MLNYHKVSFFSEIKITFKLYDNFEKIKDKCRKTQNSFVILSLSKPEVHGSD
jgi:hypothetical protein